MLLVKLEGKIFCMRFWYHMYGASTGSLEILRVVKQAEDDHTPKVTAFTTKDGDGATVAHDWKRSGNQGNKWIAAEVDLGVVPSVAKGTVHWVSYLK